MKDHWERNNKAKAKRMEKIPKDRICPRCKRLRVNSLQWVGSICRSCFQVEVHKGFELVWEPENRFVVDGLKLVQDRHPISRPKVAKRCGWSSSYQQAIESGDILTISQDVADTIIQALQELGKDTSFEVETRWKVPELRKAREAMGISIREFSSRCGWSNTYQQQLETGRFWTISDNTKNVISDVCSA